MNRIKKYKLKYSIMLICIFISYITILLPIQYKKTFAEKIQNENTETRIYSTATIDDSFDDSSIIIILDKAHSAINKLHRPTDFGLNEDYVIKDLTYLENDISKYKYLNTANFRQILQIQLPTPSKNNVLTTIQNLNQVDGLLRVEPNYIEEANSGLPENSSGTQYEKLWGLHGENGINADKAWHFTTGSNAIRVGIIDSGIAYHQDLNLNLVAGNDFCNYSSPTNDDPTGHGTHVAGIVGASGQVENGVVGVCQNIQLVPLQVVEYNSKNQNYYFDTIARIEAIMNASFDIPILNYSGGSLTEDPDLPPGFTTTQEALKLYDGLFITSAGNNALNVDNTPHYPSDYADETNLTYEMFYNRVISVGALNENGTRRSNSNYGENSVSIYAPGTSILSTLPNNSYGIMSGTSMAAPHVTGVAALLLSYNPDLTAAQLKSAILNGADTISISTPDGTQSVKKLNAIKALQYVMDNYGDSVNLKFNDRTFSKAIDATSSYFEESNCMLMMKVTNAYEYDFSISSTSALNITLYDENLDEISISTTSLNGGCQIDFSEDLSIGKYYLQASYVSETATGTIEITISGEPHTHEYNHKYVSLGASGHSAFCECGAGIIQSHAVNGDDPPAKRRCIKCNQLVLPGDEGFIIMSLQAQYVTANGSFIAPDGVIYLVEADIEAYLNDTLIFYKKDDFSLEIS